MAIGTEKQDPMGLSKMGNMFSKEEEEAKESKEEVQEEVAETEEDEKEALYVYLETMGGPDKQQIEQWKMAYGSIQMLPLDEAAFVYRTLKRSEWNVMKAQFMAAGEAMTEDQKKEQIVMKCLLWPKIDGTDFAFTEAGLVDSLYEAISVSSYFLSPQMIMNMVMRL